MESFLRSRFALLLVLFSPPSSAANRQASSSISRHHAILLDLKHRRELLQINQLSLAIHIVREARGGLLGKDEAELSSFGDRLHASEPPSETGNAQELDDLVLLSGAVGAREAVLGGIMSVGEVRGGEVGRELRKKGDERRAEAVRRETRAYDPVEELIRAVGKLGTSTLDRLCEDGDEERKEKTGVSLR